MNLENIQSECYQIKWYLSPGGSRPYARLADDLEKSRAAGKHVMLLSVPGFLMVSAYPDVPDDPQHNHYPWNIDGSYYSSAADALADRGGLSLDELYPDHPGSIPAP